jgi:CDP-diacylglycerol--serine O-phosphatidyltransferase
MANLVCGCLAILFLLKWDNFVWPSVLIGIAAILDLFDGWAARILGGGSELGKQLDSLADVVSFGVAPAFIAVWLPTTDDTMSESIPWIRFIGLLIAVAAAYRLARFNIDPNQSDGFLGMPVPANALFWCSLPIISIELGYRATGEFPKFVQLLTESTVMSLVIIFAVLMVSRIPLFSLKFKGASWQKNKQRWIFIILMPIVFLFIYMRTEMWSLTVPVLIMVYVLFSMFYNYFTKNHEVQSGN